jgi:hypothetical protein
MNQDDTPPRPYARLADVKAGDHLIAGEGFFCLTPGSRNYVTRDRDGDLVIFCHTGAHMLLQHDLGDGLLTGLYPSTENTPMSDTPDDNGEVRRGFSDLPFGRSGAQKPTQAQLADAAGRSLLDFFAGRKALALNLHRDDDFLTGYSLAIVDATNPPGGTSPSPDTRTILAAIAEIGKQMTDTNTLTGAAIAKLVLTDQALATEIQALLDKLAGEPQAIADAVSLALTNAGASDAQTAAAVDAATAGAQALVDKIAAVFPPAAGTGGNSTGGNTTGDPPPAPIVVTPTSISGAVGALASGVFFPTGGTGPYQFVADANAPTGLVIGETDGTWSITPAGPATGAFDLVTTDINGVTGDTTVSYSFS